MRSWLITWTTYATWLPGDIRGFVSNVREGDGPEVRHNIVDTPYDSDVEGLRYSALANLTGSPIYLFKDQAIELLAQFHETATIRRWTLHAIAIMNNHVHVVLTVDGDPDPETLLRDLKSYGSRRLNRKWGKPESGTWWTKSGSKRKLPDKEALVAAIRYVREQPNPLVIWVREGDLG